MTTERPSRSRLGALAAVGAAASLLVGCTAGDGGDEPGADGSVQVMVALPALQFIATEVGGQDVQVQSLIPDGADPHGAELSPADVAGMERADLVVYLSGMQPATDEAVQIVEGPVALDVLDAVSGEVDPQTQQSPAPPVDRDPHFWLDPLRLAEAGDALAQTLAEVQPDLAEEFESNAAALREQLAALDADLREGLAPCAGDTVVVTHEALGFLTARYGLEQVGIAGVDPEVEPSPARLREVREVVEANSVRTIYFEARASSQVAERLAEDLGIETGVLDPMERTGGADYLQIMDENLRALTAGLPCEG